MTISSVGLSSVGGAPVGLTVSESGVESGSARPVLLLHGGGGIPTVAALGAHLAGTAHVLTPTHPGWGGTARPAELSSVAALAALYLDFLAAWNLTDVLLVGSSMGGWLAAEIALGDVEGRVSGLVIINAAGVEVAGHPIRNVAGLAPDELAEFSFHDPSKLPPRPAPTPELLAIFAGNAAALDAYAGDPYMHDPTLLARLTDIRVPTLVIWGESDQVVDLDYGRAYAAAIPGAGFVAVPAAGHLPWMENPDAVWAAIDGFASSRTE